MYARGYTSTLSAVFSCTACRLTAHRPNLINEHCVSLASHHRGGGKISRGIAPNTIVSTISSKLTLRIVIYIYTRRWLHYTYHSTSHFFLPARFRGGCDCRCACIVGTRAEKKEITRSWGIRYGLNPHLHGPCFSEGFPLPRRAHARHRAGIP